MHGIAWAAKASLSSIRSRSLVLRPARARSLSGSRHRSDSHAATDPHPPPPSPRSGPAASLPSSAAARSLSTVSAAAPSLMPLEVPAVTVPSLVKAGFILARPSRVTSARGCSSRQNSVGRPYRASGTGTSSSSKAPAVRAAWARRWLSTAKASCSSRVTPYCAGHLLRCFSRAKWSTPASCCGLTNRQPTVVSAIGRGRAVPGACRT